MCVSLSLSYAAPCCWRADKAAATGERANCDQGLQLWRVSNLNSQAARTASPMNGGRAGGRAAANSLKSAHCPPVAVQTRPPDPHPSGRPARSRGHMAHTGPAGTQRGPARPPRAWRSRSAPTPSPAPSPHPSTQSTVDELAADPPNWTNWARSLHQPLGPSASGLGLRVRQRALSCAGRLRSRPTVVGL